MSRFKSPPHNHLVWAVIGVYKGQENNVFYQRKDEIISEVGRQECHASAVITLPADKIHRIENPLPHRSCSLQVYGGALNNPARSLWNPATLQEGQFVFDTFIQYEREMTSKEIEAA
jgi:predicted metal-dependent enzyme (double-stranded beta helix superfamily)